MATRCQIGFGGITPEECTHRVYVHYDGYPENIIPQLEAFALWFHKGRGLGDYAYASARLLQRLMNDSDRRTNDFQQTGFGICDEVNADISYFYAFKEGADKSITLFVYEGTKLVETYRITKEQEIYPMSKSTTVLFKKL